MCSSDLHETSTVVHSYNTKDKFEEWHRDLTSCLTAVNAAASDDIITKGIAVKTFINKWHATYAWRAVANAPTVQIEDMQRILFKLNISSQKVDGEAVSKLYDCSNITNIILMPDPSQYNPVRDLVNQDADGNPVDVVYAFEVPVGRIQYDKKKLIDVSQNIKEMLSTPSMSSMSVEQLFLNFSSADIINFDSVHTKLPPSVEQDSTLAAVISEYYKTLGSDHGHVLGYTVIVPPNVTNDRNATFQPKMMKNTNSLADTDSGLESSFNYAAMIDDLPQDFRTGSYGTLDRSLLPVGCKTGIMMLSGETFINYLKTQIDRLVTMNSYNPHVNVKLSYGSAPPFTISVQYNWGVDYATAPPPVVNYTKPNALQYSYDRRARDTAGATNDYVMELNFSLNTSLTFNRAD